MGTIITGLVIAIWIVFSILHIRKNKQDGCGGSCSGCSSKPSCTSNIYEAYRKDHQKPAA